MTYSPEPFPAPATPCWFHPDRMTALSCSRCGRPACPGDLQEAAVGFHCPVCVQEGRRHQRQPRTFAGSRIGEQPLVSYVLVAINLVVFVIGAAQARSVMSVSDSALTRWGGMVPAMVGQGEYWRVVTSGFLHSGLVHIALNMMALVLLGVPLERQLGRVRFLVVYLLSLLGGSAMIMWLSAEVSLTVGASGAIFGLMGGLIVTFRRLRADMRQLVVVLAINLFITFQLGAAISWQGHVGGLVVGAAAAAIMVYPPAKVRKAWQVGGSIGLLLVLLVTIGVRAPQVDRWECAIRGDRVYCLTDPKF